jgi:hypothetical protein
MGKEENLIIRIDEASVSITEVSHFNGSIDTKDSVFFEFSAYSDIDLKNTLKEKLAAFSENKNYDNILVCWTGVDQFLAPMKLFQESNLSDLANLVFGSTDKNELDYNRLPEINRVCIYCIPLWVKTIFIQVFPMASVKAETAIFSRAIAQNTNLKPKLIMRVFAKTVSFSLLGNTLDTNREITFSNQYEYQSNEDILYLLLNIISNIDKADQPKSLDIFFDTTESSQREKSFLELLKTTNDLQNLKTTTFNRIDLSKIYSRCV